MAVLHGIPPIRIPAGLPAASGVFTAMAAAWKQVEDWLDCPPVWIPQPTERHREILGSLLKSQGGRANLVPDAHLAALAIEHGLILCSTDGDYARFPDLHWENPPVDD